MSGATIVVIDDSTSKVIAGVYEFDRDDGGILIVPSGSTLPASPEPKELFWRTTDSKLYRRNDGNTAWDAITAAVEAHLIGGSEHLADTLANLNSKISDATLDDASSPRDPNAHAASHQNGGSDEISVAGLSGTLADPQTPSGHGSTHEDGGSDEISVTGLSGTLADPQTPSNHGSTHQDGGADEISVAGLNGVLADKQDADKLQGRNVAATAPTTNQVLAWSGSAWSPSDPSSGIFGTQFQESASDSESSTTSTAWQQKLKMTTPSLPAGTYRIGWSYEWRYSLASQDFRGRVQVDDTTTVAEQRQEPKDPNSNQSHPASGFGYVTLGAGSHEIDIDYCASSGGNTASIKRARLEIWRVS